MAGICDVIVNTSVANIAASAIFRVGLRVCCICFFLGVVCFWGLLFLFGCIKGVVVFCFWGKVLNVSFCKYFASDDG